MKIIGKINNKLVIKCDDGHHYEWSTFGTTSGCFFCEHEKGSTHFDFIEFNKLTEITDKNIINEIELKRRNNI